MLFLYTPTTHSLRIYAQQMHSLHRMTTDRDAKSAISGRDIPLPKLNVEGSIPFTRFYLDEMVTRFSTEETSPFSWAHGGAFGTTIIHIIET